MFTINQAQRTTWDAKSGRMTHRNLMTKKKRKKTKTHAHTLLPHSFRHWAPRVDVNGINCATIAAN